MKGTIFKVIEVAATWCGASSKSHTNRENAVKMYMCFFYCMIAACFLLSNMSLYAQSFQVNGTVYDENGESLPGVSILVKGSNIGTVSDVSGNYSITAPNENAVLQFTFGSYRTQEIQVSRRHIPVTMMPSQMLISAKSLTEGTLFTKGKKVYELDREMSQSDFKKYRKLLYYGLEPLTRNEFRLLTANSLDLQMMYAMPIGIRNSSSKISPGVILEIISN